MTSPAEKSTTAEAARIVWDSARRYLDDTASVSHTYFTAWLDAAQAGLRASFDLQDAMIQTSRVMLDAITQANRDWFDQTANSVRESQEATSRLVTAGLDAIRFTLPKAQF